MDVLFHVNRDARKRPAFGDSDPDPKQTGLYSKKKNARKLKFRIQVVCNLCSKDNDADQLHSYCTTDRHLCFGACKIRFSRNAGFSLPSIRVVAYSHAYR